MRNNEERLCRIVNKTPFISVNELNQVLGSCTNNNRIIKEEIEIKFQNRVDKIDIIFIAGLILFNMEYGTKFRITSRINDESRLYELRQYLKQYEQLYQVDSKSIFPEFWGIGELKESHFVASDSFVPIIFIDNNMLDQFFTKMSQGEIAEDLYGLYRKYIEKDHSVNEKEKNYFSSEDSIKKELYNWPPIYIFVFSILYKKIDPFVKFKEKGIENPVQRTLEIWEFTKEYVKGIHELAKNIIEHSSTRRGIIVIRAYDIVEDTEERNLGKVLETYVTDFGTQGIIPHLLENTQEKAQSKESLTAKMYEEDLRILEGNFCLKDFVKPSVKKNLKQQLYRDMAHYGLMKFYQLIERNEGVVVSSSIGKNGKRDIYASKEEYKDKSLDYGTSYFFQLPFRHELFKAEIQAKAELPCMQGSSETVSGLFELMKMIPVRRIEDIPEEYPAQNIILCLDWEGEIKGREDEAVKCLELANLKPHGKIGYIAINMDKLSLSASSLLRFMAHLSRRYKEPAIIYNIDFKIYWEMIKDNELYYETFKTFDKELPYWYEGKSVLVYSRTEGNSYNSYNFADILFGRNKKEHQTVNYIISHTFINALTILNNFVNPDREFKIQNSLQPYFYQSSLLPFDILLKITDDKTIFQSNLEVLLQQELKIRTDSKSSAEEDTSPLPIYNANDKLEQYVNSMEGYKMSNTHFKIGSKLHSEHFFYAKRLFQNSYYTARIAMLLAIRIEKEIPNKEQEITIVGYEMYSELLLSLISKFLTESGYTNINRFITQDMDESMKCIPENASASGTIIITVPIASTGSTSGKIKNYLADKFSFTFEPGLPKTFNVITASDPDSEEKYRSSNQESLIDLITKWHLPIDCKWCYNDSCSRPLFETDKTSITPALIFNYPESKPSDLADGSIDFKQVDFKEALLYKKVKRNNEYLFYSTDTDVLIEKNKDKIIIWLGEVKNELSIQSTDKIVILSPCHYSNTQFINMVNDHVFNSSATIIHYQSDADYISNFRFMYENFLTQENRKIVFVDDTLISGKTFFRIYDLFRNIAKYKKTLTAAIFLADNSSPNVHKRVSRATGERDDKVEEKTKGEEKTTEEKVRKNNLFSFVNVNLPTLPKIFKKNPLEHEVKRYKDLTESVLHDSLKKVFANKENELNKFNRLVRDKNGEVKKSEQHYKMFKATHLCYNFFGYKMGKEKLDFESMEFSQFLNYCDFDGNNTDDKIPVMKVLSQYPFLLYMPVRKKVFQWHKKWLDDAIFRLSGKLDRISSKRGVKMKVQNKYDESDLEEIVTTDDFQEFKFLLRRSVFLGNYKTLSQDFFTLLSQLMNHIGDIDIDNEKQPMTIRHFTILPEDLFQEKKVYREKPLSETEKINLKDFYIFLLTQYIEMIQKNPWCAYQIKQSLTCTKHNFKTDHGIQFVRMLTVETAMVMNDFYEMLLGKKRLQREWINLYEEEGISMKDRSVKIILDECNTKIKDFLEKNKGDFTDKNKFILANKVLNLENADGTFKVPFLNYLWVKQLLYTDKQKRAAEISLTEKTEKIFTKLREFFTKGENIGAFFIVTDGKKQPHLVYDRRPDGESLLKELDAGNHTLLYSFLNGQPDAMGKGMKVIIEYLRTNGASWTDQYVIKNPKQESFVNEYKWLLLIRISDSEAQTMGLMGFYSWDEKQRDDILAKQLLMLLCKDLAAFIKRHHKNEEFAGLREAEATRRFAYLAGHGRQMMQKLAQTGKREFGNVVSTMEKLQYLFATKYISPSGNTAEKKEKLCEELLKTFYTETISVSDLKSIEEMTKLIYKSPIIENAIGENDYDIRCNVPSSLDFKFNKEILLFICFELLVNAKKNRFHFTDFYKPCFSYCTINKNKIHVEICIEEGLLKITVTGSGAFIPEKIRDKINTGYDPKPRNEISGLALIRKIIKILDDDNTLKIQSIPFRKTESRDGDCKCAENPAENPCIIYENTLTVYLNPIENGTRKKENISY